MLRRLSWLVAASCAAAACGGRYLENAGGNAGGSSSRAGSTQARAGASGADAGGNGSAGSSGAGTAPTAGSSAAGTSATAGCCDPIACPTGYEPVLNFKGCACHCQVTDAACQAQRDDYAMFRQQVVSKYRTLPCQSNTDCTLYFEFNECAAGCGIGLVSSAVAEVDMLLNGRAKMTCDASCGGVPSPPCDAAAATCVNGTCQ